MKLTYCLSSWACEAYSTPESLEEVVAEARRSGYGFELWSRWKGEQNLFSAENRPRIARLLHGMPSSLHGGHISTFAEHKEQVDTAHAAGSKVIVCHSDTLGLVDPAPDYGLAKDVAAYAEENGVTITLENGDSPGSLERQSAALNAVPKLMACLDMGHIYCAHDHPLRDYLNALGKRIAHLHLHDLYLVPGTRRAKEDSHRPPGQCDIPFPDWQLLFAALGKLDYNGFLVVESRPFGPVEVAEQAKEFFHSAMG